MSETSPADPLARMTRTMGLVTAVMTVLVALNTMVFSCANDRFSREAAALARLDNEKEYWTDAMKDLDQLIASRPDSPYNLPNWRDRCELLASRTRVTVKTNDETNDTAGGTEPNGGTLAASEFRQVRDAYFQVEKLKKEFESKIQNDQLVGLECSGVYGKSDVTKTESALVTAKVAAEVPGYAIADDTKEAQQQRLPMIEMTPPSATGWDIDVFWCQRDNDKVAESSNYGDALRIGSQLGAIVQRQGSVDGQRLGRIRVRMLSSASQALPAASGDAPTTYPNEGRTIRFDAGDADEEKLANALSTLLRATLPGSTIPVSPQRTGSKWYLSIFACAAGKPPETARAQPGTQ